MKKIIYTLAMMLLPLSMFGQSYSSLWKKVSEAQTKDLPKTQIEWLDQIARKAEKEAQYGHLIKAQLMRSAVNTQISPDSADVEIDRLEQKAQAAKDPVLQAVYASVLGKLYQNIGDKEDKSKQWFAKSMANPQLLAQHQDREYEPAMLNGIDSKIFYDDLLHVLGFEAGDFTTLRQYYTEKGNRAAACISACYEIMAKRQSGECECKKSKYLQMVDSLIREYSDLREAGELAIEHYRFMSVSNDATTEDRVNYINYALSRWGSWPRMNVLRNALSELQRPSYNINIGDYMLLPNAERKLRVNSIRNVGELNVSVFRLNVNGNTQLDPNDKDDYAKLQKLIFPGTVQTIQRRYIGQPAWKENSDSITLEGMPVGVYLIEATTDNKDIAPQRNLLRVSDLYVMHEAQPDNSYRFVVVNATTGKPVSGATIELTTNGIYDNEKATVDRLTTNKNGEAYYQWKRTRPYIYVYTDNDHACGKFFVDSYYNYWEYVPQEDRIRVFTDRSIYRPGQQVHVAAIAWHKDNKELKSDAIADEQLTFQLLDANGKEVGTNKVSTDRFGTAAADFTLPQSGLTGRFTAVVKGNRYSNTASFQVEQYKRPTFQVEFEPYKKEYHAGDTVLLKGTAKSYAGVPVQGAKVTYTVQRRQSLWWRWMGTTDNSDVLTDSAVTADDGSFMVSVPMVYPDNQELDRPVLYNMVVNAKVTDLSGETREGAASLPLSNRSSFLTVDLPSKQLRDSLKTFSFTRRNVAGEEIEGIVRYRFDGGAWKIGAANKRLTIEQKFASGKHHLEAICEEDTVEQDVVVFSYADKKPVVETHDWFYVSGDQFPSDGKPIYLQVGTSDEDTHVYYSVYCGNKILEKGSKVLSNEVHTEKLVYKPSYGDGITINMAWVRRGRLYRHIVQLRRPVPDNHLNLAWKTFRDKLTPGQKEEWTLQVFSPDGKPARAQLLATMYDKSLDAIRSHKWYFNNDYRLTLPYTQWGGGSNATVGLYGFQDFKALSERELDFSHWDALMFGFATPYTFYSRSRIMPMSVGSVRVRGNKRMDVTARSMDGSAELSTTKSAASGNVLREVELQAKPMMAKDVAGDADDASSEQGNGDVQVRENLNETAFFYPALTSDAQGNVAIKFTLPESVTTWHFMGLAHDEEINYGQIEADAVAKKVVMVQPNLPRFIRMGDKAQISTRIFNTSERKASGTVRLQLLDPETENVVSEWTKPFAVESSKTENAYFDVDADQLALSSKGNSLFIARVIAEGKGFSDGEQHYLPLLPNREYVTTTVPFTQNGAGTKTIDLSQLFPMNDRNNRLTVEYTNHPAWLMVQALPTIANPYDRNAISLAAAIYANAIGQHLLQSSPKIAQTLKLWQQETGKETSLMSSLQKNEDLKSLVLSETPWVADAEKETSQKQQLVNFLDESTIGYRLSTFMSKLEALQNPDGSFSWWPGMRGSTYMTMAVTKILTRLNAMIGTSGDRKDMLDQAFSYLDRRMAEEVRELKKQEKKGARHLAPSETACNYLYASALAARPQSEDMKYLVALLDKLPTDLTIYGKAGSAVILAQYGKLQHAKEYLQSINEYSVYKEDMGRYYDTKKAYYSWFDYKIPTQVAAIEAMKALNTTDTKTVEEMQRWLLQEKRTTGWDTPLNAVDAVYAFLANNDGRADMSKLATGELSTLRIDGKLLDLPQATAGLGYVKTSVQPSQPKTFTAEKTSDGTSWGAIYAQFWQKSTDVKDASSGLKVTREIISDKNNTDIDKLKVGDKITVRITITADRDYDFVQVQDKRAACLEPAEQLSGYRGGYYCAPQDNVTNYYFDQLAKGKHIVETSYYVDREGDYSTGICTAQCAYSPEFSGREAGKSLHVTR
ncbi:MAG: alpha-2-macroglobulin [Prevotella sp.]|nr:alpha-2-macroglobulin [Prevotella sp.]